MVDITQQSDLPSVLVKSHLAASDDLFRLTTVDTWYNDVNIHCTAQAAHYGSLDIAARYGDLFVNDVISFRDVNLNDFYFANAGAGANTNITAVGSLMTTKRKHELGIRVD